MECFTSFWSRHNVEDQITTPWFIETENNTTVSIPRPSESLTSYKQTYSRKEFLEILERSKRNCLEYLWRESGRTMSDLEDLREVMKNKAEKHRTFYQRLIENDDTDIRSASCDQEMATPIRLMADVGDDSNLKNLTTISGSLGDGGGSGTLKRQRKQGVHEMNVANEVVEFKSVKKLCEHYSNMIEKRIKNLDENSKSSLLIPPTSGYCSSSASNNSDDERSGFAKNTVRRCGSNDSAMGQSDEDGAVINSNWGEKVETVEENYGREFRPQVSPYSPRGSIDHSSVPSRTLIEAQYVPIIPSDRKFSDSASVSDISGSRRESCITDDGEEPPRYRYWRTPSVVVSDYSDDIMGLTLEDIEYIRSQKENSSSPDSSLHSSCSNLNYCGSTISGLDTEYVLSKPFRKSSDCSTCSTLSGDEDTDSLHPNKVSLIQVLKGSTLHPNRSPSRSPSPGSADTSPRLSRRGSAFRSLSPSSPISRRGSMTYGYEQYQKSLLEVPVLMDYGDASSDDLSSEWDSDVPEPKIAKQSGWRKLRNIVQWTPFFQTYRKHRYPWVQLAGHQGNFKAGPDQGTILKKLCPKEEKCFKILMKDVLRPYVPEYKGLVASDDGECSYIQLQDLLGDFVSPCVMDCKIGVRTYLEEELAKAKEKPKLRKDMYEKMCQIDQEAPTEEEHKVKGVTKPRYMVWRETISSTATLGFRIEGIRNADGTSSKDFKTTKSKDQVIKAFESFTEGFPHAIPKYIQRLKAIKATLESSDFFNTHEIIGSSLLFVHDRYSANVWLIDFAKTIALPENVKINHNSSWRVGNHEDGYLIGVNNLIKIFMTMLENQPVAISPPLSLHDPKELEDPNKMEEDINT